MKTEKYFEKRNYSQDDFVNAIKTSTSIRQVLIKLNLKPSGGNYRCVQTLVKRLELNTSHFTGQAHNKGKKLPSKRPLSDYLSNKFSIQSNKLRKRLLKDKVFKHECSCCKNSEWLNKPIPLELDHINGNHEDNTLSNLRLLCPNCHALTPTYRGKNKKK